MGHREQQQHASERGAVLIHVAVVVLAITGLATFVIDYGVYWESRRQIQNSADAAALAGATSLAFDNWTNLTPTGPAATSAVAAANANLVWGQPPAVNPAGDVTITSGVGACPAPNVDGTCVRVDAYRTVARANPLPTFFGNLVGLTQQDVLATATAQVLAGNSSHCIKPIAVADKWFENNPGPVWTPTSSYDPTGPNPDVYVAPTPTSPGSGFTVLADFGVELLLKPGSPGDTITSGWFQAVRFPGMSGGADYRNALANCVSGRFGIGDYLDKENGNMIGPTRQGVQDIIAQDPNAVWNSSTRLIDNSCVASGTCPGNPNAKQSPRIVSLPAFDLDEYMATGGPGNGSVRIVNILGFFILDMQGNDVRGILMPAPGLADDDYDSVTIESAFTRTIRLVR